MTANPSWNHHAAAHHCQQSGRLGRSI